MSDTTTTSIEWIQKKNRAQNDDSPDRDEYITQLKKDKWRVTGWPSAFNDSSLENSIEVNDCYIVREFLDHDVPIEDVRWYIDIYREWRRKNGKYLVTESDIKYHGHEYCSCEHGDVVDPVKRVTLQGCTKLRRGELKNRDELGNDRKFRTHERGLCNHRPIVETPNVAADGGGYEGDDEKERDERSDLEKLIDGDKDELKDVYIEDDENE